MTFAGDKKVGMSVLGKIERKFIDYFVPKVPKGIETYHLTLMTIPISIGIIAASFVSIYNIAWLWAVSGLIVLQWVTDSLDGSLGKYRNTGLIKWGYYMDHLLDYLFLCSVLIGYSLLLPDNFKYVQFFVLMICGAFMVNSFLSFAATNEFKISYLGIGPTEMRILFVFINTMIIFFGKTYLAFALPYILVFCLIGLCYVVYVTQDKIWKIDMRAHKEK